MLTKVDYVDNTTVIHAKNLNDIQDEIIEQTKAITALLDKTYPVGSIYMSANAESPASLFGGTWTQIRDRFVLAAGDTYAAGQTGGAATSTLSISEIPAHNHAVSINIISGTSVAMYSVSPVPNYAPGSAIMGVTDMVGGGQPHSIMPPYITRYVWQRVA